MTGAAAGANLAAMLAILQAVIGTLCSALRPRASLAAENLVLRQQLAILRRETPRPRLRPLDRAFLGHGRPCVVAVGGLSRDRPTGEMTAHVARKRALTMERNDRSRCREISVHDAAKHAVSSNCSRSIVSRSQGRRGAERPFPPRF